MWAAFYGLLMALAVAATWRRRELRPIGVALFVSWLMSNAASLIMGAPDKPMLYTITELGVAGMAYSAWLAQRSWALVAVICLAGLSICANVALASVGTDASNAQSNLWELFTNICFALECIFAVIARMLLYGYGSLDWRTGDRGLFVAAHGIFARKPR